MTVKEQNTKDSKGTCCDICNCKTEQLTFCKCGKQDKESTLIWHLVESINAIRYLRNKIRNSELGSEWHHWDDDLTKIMYDLSKEIGTHVCSLYP